jgi:hypothetical protein
MTTAKARSALNSGAYFDAEAASAPPSRTLLERLLAVCTPTSPTDTDDGTAAEPVSPPDPQPLAELQAASLLSRPERT